MANKNSIIIAIFIVCIAGIATGYKYFDFIKTDPGYCTLCHITQEGYNSWERSKHYSITCQECHSMTVIEGNKLLLDHYVSDSKQKMPPHGRENPWKSCIGCHGQEATQGSITFSKSYGHAKHVFMQKTPCNACHSGSLHDFEKVQSSNCLKCHGSKLVHGMGTAGLSCLTCHSFTGDKKSLLSSERCIECHKNIPLTGVMSRLSCHDCHNPHNKISITSNDCLSNCHSSETKVGQHKLHINKAELNCLDCHKPHSWVIKDENAPGLCDRCHKSKPPSSFIF